MILFDVIKLLGLLVYYFYINAIKGIYTYCQNGTYKYQSFNKLWKTEDSPIERWGYVVLILIFILAEFV